MKKAVLLFLLLLSLHGIAQNYQCLQSGVKHYFTNGNGYLRGIRIDSTRTLGDTIVYYPFHTPRGNYLATAGSVSLDSTGGSWLGKRVMQVPDGAFIFDNNWNDSVIIKTQANLSDSWFFYRDSSSLYYKATVISIDTMTVLGNLDTVKSILINAYNGTSLVSTDPVNGFQILLSKNHGFVQVFDLYTFPYHLPGAVYTNGLDYYLDNCISTTASLLSVIPVPFSSGPTSFNSVFTLIELNNPTNEQLYDWNIGDVYEYSFCNGLSQWPSPVCDPVSTYFLDTIIGKTVATSNIQYQYEGLVSNIEGAPYYSASTTYPYTTSGYGGTFTDDNSYLIDTAFMPEEFDNSTVYYYYPNDTNYCIKSPLYIAAGAYLNGVHYFAAFESTTWTTVSKLLLGLIHRYQVGEDAGYLVNDQTLFYYSRGGNSCGTYGQLSLGVNDVYINNKIQIFPNPATTGLTIKANNTISKIDIINLVGQTVLARDCNNSKIELDVSQLPSGVYFIKINSTEVQKFIKE